MAVRILFDEWGFQETHGGVSRLHSEVMRNLPAGFEWILPQPYTVNEYLKGPPFNIQPAKFTYNDFVRRVLRGHAFPGANRLYKVMAHAMPGYIPACEVLNRNARMKALRTGDFDVYQLTSAHWLSYDWKVIYGKKPFVVTVCDLIPEIIAKNSDMSRYRRPLLEAATQVIAISEHTKRDVMRLYGIADEKISVIYLGSNLAISSESKHRNATEDPYVLYVGKRTGYKNFEWMVKALLPFLRGDSGFSRLSLRCTGAPFSASERKMLKDWGVEDAVKQQFVTDEEMRGLFADAVCFVYPSLYEGFGIPILDAFAVGCPVLVSNASCFPEIAGDAALYFDLGNVDDFRLQIKRLLPGTATSGALRRELIERGRERMKPFTWERCARKTAAVYQKAIETFRPVRKS